MAVLKSINEPTASTAATGLFPKSINEPAATTGNPLMEREVAEHNEAQWRTTSVTTATPVGHDVDYSDPDVLEDELEQAEEEGDFTPTHRGRRR